MNKKYFTEEERKAANREGARRWREKHPEYKEKKAEYNKQYRQTPMGRADKLLYRYRKSDIEKNRGECTIPNAKWIVDNIFTKKCAHCEETDWSKLGCNRLDNSLPHTPDNVEPCCFICNCKLGGRPKKTLRADEMTL